MEPGTGGLTFRGVYAIPPTPFTPTGLVDLDSLRRCVDFCVDRGAHGLVGPVNASEFSVLTDSERMEVAEALATQLSGRLPLIIGVSATSTEGACRFARHAVEIGASAVIAMPPYVRHPTAREVPPFYTAVAAAAHPLPVWIQHYQPPLGLPMSSDLIASMVAGIEGVDYLKEESVYAPQVMTEVQAKAGPALKGMMGGMAGRYLPEEYRRGASGTMPACEVIDVHARIWNLLDSGEEREARALHRRLLPLLTYEAMHSFTVYKEVLVRRGVFECAATRTPGAGYLDRQSHRELDELLEALAEDMPGGLAHGG